MGHPFPWAELEGPPSPQVGGGSLASGEQSVVAPPPTQHTAPQSFCPRQTNQSAFISEQAIAETGKSEGATSSCTPPEAEAGTLGKHAGSLLSAELGIAPRKSSRAMKARPSWPAPRGLQTLERSMEPSARLFGRAGRLRTALVALMGREGLESKAAGRRDV